MTMFCFFNSFKMVNPPYPLSKTPMGAAISIIVGVKLRTSLHNNEVLIKYIFKNYPFLAGAFVAAGAAADLAGAPPVATRNASSISLGKDNFNFIATLIERLSAIEG